MTDERQHKRQHNNLPKKNKNKKDYNLCKRQE